MTHDCHIQTHGDHGCEECRKLAERIVSELLFLQYIDTASQTREAAIIDTVLRVLEENK